MKVIVAQTAGFCMGVRRAVDLAEKTALTACKAVYTLGELIHNKKVVSDLAKLGIEVSEELPDSGVVIIRAHGVAQDCKDILAERGVEVVDATCPHVLSSQKTIAQYSSAGGTVLILGDSNHPEVVGLCGYAVGGVEVIESIEDLVEINLPEEFLFIAQTTFSQKLFDKISKYLILKYPKCKIVDSICDATQKRQDEALKLSGEVDLMIVVGGRHSANTKRLVEIGATHCARVIHIEDACELEQDDFVKCSIVGVTAGASTPVGAVEKVLEFIDRLDGLPVNGTSLEV